MGGIMERKQKDAIAIGLVVVLIAFSFYLMYDYVHEDEPEFPYNIHESIDKEFEATQYFETSNGVDARIEGFITISDAVEGYDCDISFVVHTNAEYWIDAGVHVDPAFVVTDIRTNHQHPDTKGGWREDGTYIQLGSPILPAPAGVYFADIHAIWSGKGADDGEFTFDIFVPYDDVYVTVTVPSE